MPVIFSNAPGYKRFFVFYERFFIHTFLWVSEIMPVKTAVSASQRHLYVLGSEQLFQASCVSVDTYAEVQRFLSALTGLLFDNCLKCEGLWLDGQMEKGYKTGQTGNSKYEERISELSAYPRTSSTFFINASGLKGFEK